MKSIRVNEFGGPEVLRLEDMPNPVPEAGQVKVEIRSIGVNPVETYVRTGKYPKLPSLPYTPGTDAAGVVASVGLGVTSVSVGERVYVHYTLTGAYAEACLCEEWQVHPLPEGVSFDEGAAVGVPAGAAWRALFVRGVAQAGETILVHGASGAAGLSAVQLARAAGLIVIGTAGTDEGRAEVMDAGAHYATAHGDYDEIRRVSPEQKGVPLIVEFLANENLPDDLRVLAPHGRVVVVGSRGPVQIDPRMTMSTELDIRGMSLPNATREEYRAMHLALGAALESRVLRPRIGPIFPLTEANRAHEAMASGKSEGKILLHP